MITMGLVVIIVHQLFPAGSAIALLAGFTMLMLILKNCGSTLSKLSGIQVSFSTKIEQPTKANLGSNQMSNNVNLIELIRELESVMDWVTLGLLLGVPRHTLQEIAYDRVHVTSSRLQMLDEWIRNYPEATWDKVVSALRAMSEFHLANTIATKHCNSDLSRQLTTTNSGISPMEHVPDIGNLLTELKNVVDLFLLGVNLGMKSYQLKEIERKNNGESGRSKRDMLIEWMNYGVDVNWCKIVHAVRKTGHYSLADRLAIKHTSQLRFPVGVDATVLSVATVVFLCFYATMSFEVSSIFVQFAVGLHSFLTLLSWEIVIMLIVNLPLLMEVVLCLWWNTVPPTKNDYTKTKKKMTESDGVTLKDLLDGLQDLTDWYLFGKTVGIPLAQLIAIQRDGSTNDERKRRMLSIWMKLESLTWARVTSSLFKCGLPTLGWHISKKHDVPVTQQLIDEGTGNNSETVNENIAQESSESKDFLGATKKCPMGLFDHDGVREVSVRDLLSELSEVTNWFDLGIFLEIPLTKLQEIHEDYDDIDECKLDMILLWRQMSIPNWRALVEALGKIGMDSLAIKIADKYGILLPHSLQHKCEQLKSKLDLDTDIDEELQISTGQALNGKSAEFAETPDQALRGKITVQEMMSALSEVTVQWFLLGIYLGIPGETLQTIRVNRRSVEHCKNDMLIKWSEQDNPSWEKLIQGLIQIKMFSLAAKIATKFRIALPLSVTETLKEKLPMEEMRVLEVVQESNTVTTIEIAKITDEQPTLQELNDELKEVDNWYCFGSLLGVSTSTLRAIERDYGKHDPKRCKLEMLNTWLLLKPRKWSEIVQALVKMGLGLLAQTIAQNHGIPLDAIDWSIDNEEQTDQDQRLIEGVEKRHQEELMKIQDRHLIDLQEEKRKQQELAATLEEKEKELLRKHKELSSKDRELKEKDEELRFTNDILAQKAAELERMTWTLEKKEEEFHEKYKRAQSYLSSYVTPQKI